MCLEQAESKMKKQKLRNILNYIYPIIFLTSNPIALYINNFDNVNIAETIRSILVCFIFASIMLIIMGNLFKLKTQITSILSCLIIFVIFSFPVSTAINNGYEYFKTILGFSIFLKLISILYLVGIILLIAVLPRILKKHEKLASGINFAFMLCIVFFMFIQIGSFIYKSNKHKGNQKDIQAWNYTVKKEKVEFIDQQNKRDIYLIILDGYSSADVLRELYDYDITWFYSQLENRGFHVFLPARTNYSQTRTSIASLMNMDYLDSLLPNINKDSTNGIPLREVIRNNRVIQILSNNGYTIESTNSGYFYTSLDAFSIKSILLNKISTFEICLLKRTIFYPFFHNELYQLVRDGTLSNINSIAPPMNELKFHFAHIYAPHPPFVFGRNGETYNPPYIFENNDADALIKGTSIDYYHSRYPEQVEYISKEILKKIDQLQADTQKQPIIILIGDHGSGMSVDQDIINSSNHFERMNILHAVYFPGINSADLPDDTTPINIFRIIFNLYFKTNFQLLENRSFVSSYTRPYSFVDVTELVTINQANEDISNK